MLVTHDQAEALSMGREVAVLRAGRLVQTAPAAALYRTPADLDVARFVGEAVVLAGHARRGLVHCALGDIPLIDPHMRGWVQTMIRPEQILVRRAGGEAVGSGAARPATPATALSHAFYGPHTVLQLRLDGVLEPISARILGHDVPAPGEQIVVSVVGAVMAYPGGPEESKLAHEPDALAANTATRP